MARSLEELIIFKRTALRYLLIRESRLLALGKKPVNKKIANFVQKHQGNDDLWSSFLDTLNEDLTRNIHVYEWKLEKKSIIQNKSRIFRLDSVCRETLKRFDVMIWGGKMTDAPVVKVEHGQLQGRVVTSPTGKAFYSFQGIPYAKPPLGSLRFRAPQPVEPWEGIREATAEGNVSAQIDPLIHKEFIGDENCLFLNVYTPNLDGAFLPVMVYIHGGGFKHGSGNTSLYGADYLVEKDVVIVTINYRCGPLGFLCLNTPEVPGNAGLKDMAQAIQWVKNNIENFGGNSGNMTLFGESAGGVSVSLLTASPLTKNLINKAIIQSGTGINSWAFQKQPLENAKDLARILGCDSEDYSEILEFLMSTPVREIVDAAVKMAPPELFYEKGANIFAPVIEKEFPGVEAALTESFLDLVTSGRTADIPIMIGSTTLEFTVGNPTDDLQVFIPDSFNLVRNSTESVAIAEKIKQLYFNGAHIGVENLNKYYQLLSDKLINIDTHRYIQYLVQASNKPVYYYKFDYVGELNLNGKLLLSLELKHASHMDELGYLFKNILQKDVEPTASDVRMRERMVRLWTNFAKSGNPTPDENHYITVTWLPVHKDLLYYLNLGSELSLNTNPDKEKMDFWDSLYSRYFKIWEHPLENNEIVPVLTPSPATKDANTFDTVEEEPDVTEPVEVVETEVEESVKPEVKVEETTPEEKVEEITPEVQEEETVTVVKETVAVVEEVHVVEATQNGDAKAQLNGNGHVEEVVVKARTSNEIKMIGSNGVAKDVIRANDPPEDDLPKNIGVNKFVNFFESLGGKK